MGGEYWDFTDTDALSYPGVGNRHHGSHGKLDEQMHRCRCLGGLELEDRRFDQRTPRLQGERVAGRDDSEDASRTS